MKKLLLLLAIATAAFVSCTKNLGPGAPKDRLKDILLGKDTLQLYVGETRQVPVTISPSNYGADSIKWKSSDTTIISITKTGFLTARKVGSSTITVSNLTNTISVNCLISVVPAPVDSLKIGLIAYYPFNNSAADSSGNKFNGTANSVLSIADRNGKANSAYYFDGTTSNITINDNTALRLNNTDFTLNMWINPKTYIYDSGSALLSKNAGAYQNGWNCSLVGYDNQNGGVAGNPFYNVSGGNDPFALGSSVIDTGKWSMLSIVYHLSKQQISFYINGVYVNSVSNIPTPNAQTTARLHIGNNSLADVPNSFTPAYFYNGALDDIRIYNRALNVTLINILYKRPN